ncbi:MAG: glycosyltransferase family 39 protein, partial [Deltaproteobacteria bacterium]|nr:glycosyltransferase family 39 protein [Deltaproteobacteria bacterium]
MDASSSHCSRWAAATLVVAVAGLRLVYLAWFCPLDLAPDEAYYWDWSRQLDWSYQSKGPLVAWLIRASCEVFGATVLAIRVPAVVCGSLLLAGLYVLTVQVHRSERLGFGVVAVALTLPIVAAGSMLMTIDAPFTCAWTWALVFGHRAACRSTAWAWPMAGVCICIGLLAKHTMVLWLPSFVLFLLTTPAMRALLCRPGFWVMTGIGSLGGVPILLWNASHHWPMLRHTQIHAGLESDALLNPLGPLHFLATQFALMLGFWFAAWLWAMWQHRPTRESSPDLRFLGWMSAP